MEDLSVRHREVVAIALHNDHTALTLIMSVDVKDYSSYNRYIHHPRDPEVIRGTPFYFSALYLERLDSRVYGSSLSFHSKYRWRSDRELRKLLVIRQGNFFRWHNQSGHPAARYNSTQRI